MDTVHKKISHRLKIARGHLSKVIDMIEHDYYAIDIIYQSKAIQHSLRNVDKILLESYLQTSLNGYTKGEKNIKEVIKVFKIQR